MTYFFVETDDIFESLHISHEGIRDFFNTSSSWIETTTSIATIFKYDQNRRLHFDEGFLCACYRIFKDTNVSSIGSADHFPYRDLTNFRTKVGRFAELYSQGIDLPPPLFFYPAPYQLEILDGVHRCLATLEIVRLGTMAASHFVPDRVRIWTGFNRDFFAADIVVNQLNYHDHISSLF
jgi:hypothetical protein